MMITRRSKRFGLLVTAASFAGAAAFAAAPPAGERIGNQATATYTNSSGDTVSVTSNKVETIVQQIAALDLAIGATETAAPGGKVFIPHTITNLGNGTDFYALTQTATSANFTFSSIKILPDANRDGIADSTTPITVTPSLDPNEVYGVIIEAVVPTNATAPNSETITLTATSDFDGTISDSNDDVITVSGDPITEIQKEMTVADTVADGLTGAGDIVTVKLTYTSTGLANAENLIVMDELDERLVYIAGSARWSDSATALTDAGNTDPATFELANGSGEQIDYQITGDTVEFHLDEVPVGRTGFVTFQAKIDDVNPVPAGTIPNFATQDIYGPLVTPPGGGAPTLSPTPTTMPPSNVASVDVDETYLITIADSEADSYVAGTDDDNNLAAAGAGTTSSTADDDGTLNDVVRINSAVSQGATLAFDFVLTNNSNAAQAIDVTFANDGTNGFPAGTSFQLVGSDGITPVAGSIGPVPVNSATVDGTTKVTLLATLPSSVGPITGANYNATLTAVSSNGGTPNTSTANFTGDITAVGVDLSNNNPVGNDGGDGTDAADQINGQVGGVDQPFDVITTDPGVPATFVFDINNEGPTSDNYDLAITGLPAGYSVVFTTADGTVVTNTGNVPGGATVQVTATITPPPGAEPATSPFVTTVTSVSTGQDDTVLNALTVNEIVDLRIEADQNRQAAPSGTIDIPHIIFNDGNVDITAGALTLSNTLDTFSGTLFYDVNGDQIADAGDIIIDDIADIDAANGATNGIEAGQSVNLILRVQVPSSATIGVVESETITVATALQSGASSVTDTDATDNAVTDTVTIVSGDVSLDKEQALTNCTTGAVGTYSKGTVNATPGSCITYRITALNSGTADAGNVEVTDLTPTWTTYTECGTGANSCAADAGAVTPTTPADGSSGQVSANFGTLIPGQQGVLTFTVKIDD
jgi:uncharacterized repeat protein (TIGR01451 family)